MPLSQAPAKHISYLRAPMIIGHADRLISGLLKQMEEIQSQEEALQRLQEQASGLLTPHSW